jgi:hypothetical protein
MWVSLLPLILDDGHFPEVQVGQEVRAALKLWPADSQPISPREVVTSQPGGEITPFPHIPKRLADARYRVRGRTAVTNDRRGIAAAGLFLLTDDPNQLSDQPIDLVGELGIAEVRSTGTRLWTVDQIVLHLAPTSPPAEPSQSPVPAEADDEPDPGGRRIMTASQIIARHGAQFAAARGIEAPGRIPDYSRGEQRPVDRALKWLPRLPATRQNYLLNLTLVAD